MGRERWHCHDCFHGMRASDTEGGIVVVIDVLRASTTIVTALAHGALAVRACGTVDEAREAAEAAGREEGECLLGGERGGLPIEGFDLGNSPAEYTRPRVAGRRVVVTTTNGTAAVEACPHAEALLIGCLVNRGAVAAFVSALREEGIEQEGIERPVHLVCAGTDGAVTEEDLIAAGAILDAAGPPPRSLDTVAARALRSFRDVAEAGGLVAALERSRGGRNLSAIGMAGDIVAAAAVDTIPVVPRLDRRVGWFRAEA